MHKSNYAQITSTLQIWCYSSSLSLYYSPFQSMVIDWLTDWSIDWLTWALFQLQSTTKNLFVGYSFTAGIDFGFRNPITFWIYLITLSTDRCLYQVQWIPSTLYESLYVLTLSSLLYRPCVATLVTAVISPRLICNHWLELLIFGHQAATVSYTHLTLPTIYSV